MFEWGPLAATVIASLLVAVVLLAIRIVVMQRVQSKRQRENRQETERLKAMISAYRALAGSFSPALPGDRQAQEEALADLVLFGTPRQVELAAACARAGDWGPAGNGRAGARPARRHPRSTGP